MAPTEVPIRVVLIEDHAAIRQVLAQALAAAGGFEVVGEAGAAAEGIELCRRYQPDIIVLDAFLAEEAGLEALVHVRRAAPDAAVLVFSGSTTPTLIARALRHGARGIVEKAVDFPELLEAMRRLHRGLTYFTPRVSEVVRRIVSSPFPLDSGWTLTEIERRILAGIAAGRSSKQIAATISRSTYTVENHRRRIMQKTGCRSVAELTLLALEQGLMPNIELARR